MSRQVKRFINCGMYAFTDNLRDAWQALFAEFLLIHDSKVNVEPVIRFETDFNMLRNPQMLLGHTCGYPLMRNLQADCYPICVPLFDVDGCQGKYYSSHIVVAADDRATKLLDCRGMTAAINGQDSNSGMNVLRHAVALLGNTPFFSKVVVSGSHLNSLSAVANGEADVAAIDSVSFAFIKDEWPALVERVKTIGYSEATCGLPLVIPFSEQNNPDSRGITEQLNRALSRISDKHRETLHLTGFESVVFEDYQSIIDLENRAQQAGYTELA